MSRWFWWKNQLTLLAMLIVPVSSIFFVRKHTDVSQEIIVGVLLLIGLIIGIVGMNKEDRK